MKPENQEFPLNYTGKLYETPSRKLLRDMAMADTDDEGKTSFGKLKKCIRRVWLYDCMMSDFRTIRIKDIVLGIPH